MASVKVRGRKKSEDVIPAQEAPFQHQRPPIAISGVELGGEQLQPAGAPLSELVGDQREEQQREEDVSERRRLAARSINNSAVARLCAELTATAPETAQHGRGSVAA